MKYAYLLLIAFSCCNASEQPLFVQGDNYSPAILTSIELVKDPKAWCDQKDTIKRFFSRKVSSRPYLKRSAVLWMMTAWLRSETDKPLVEEKEEIQKIIAEQMLNLYSSNPDIAVIFHNEGRYKHFLDVLLQMPVYSSYLSNVWRTLAIRPLDKLAYFSNKKINPFAQKIIHEIETNADFSSEASPVITRLLLLHEDNLLSKGWLSHLKDKLTDKRQEWAKLYETNKHKFFCAYRKKIKKRTLDRLEHGMVTSHKKYEAFKANADSLRQYLAREPLQEKMHRVYKRRAFSDLDVTAQ